MTRCSLGQPEYEIELFHAVDFDSDRRRTL